MLSHFGDFLRIDLKTTPSEALVVGVSGGPDSLCLLDLLHQAGYSVIVAHLDHGLRPESADEARGVGLIADSLGVPFVSDVRIVKESPGSSNEEVARNARYEFLFQQAAEYGAQAVVVGHNADDQAETILMHLLRGSGLDGLKGMRPFSLPNPWSNKIPLLRPLLKTWRTEIEEYCQQRGLEPYQDSSNANTKFFRNRLRHELIPLLDDYVPGVAKRLWQMADVLAEDQAVLEEIVAAAKNQSLHARESGYVSFDARVLRYQPLAIQRRLIRWAVTQLRSEIRDLDFAAVERALTPLTTLKPVTPKQLDLSLGLRAFSEGDLLYIADFAADLPNVAWPQLDVEIQLEIPGQIELANGWHLQAEIVQDVENDREHALENANPLRAWLDLGDSDAILNIRPRRPGDGFQPFGMGGKSSKISDFMINQKIPARARQHWPLVCLGDAIAWVAGYRIGNGFSINPKTRRAIFLQLLPPKIS